MQIIQHKNTHLTVCQRFFIEKSLELLYLGSIDSYRVRLNNPLSILVELKYCLESFEIGRIKHFTTIRSKDKNSKALIDEALSLLQKTPNYLSFNSISQKYIIQLINSVEENNYKRLISTITVLLEENTNYLEKLINGVYQRLITKTADVGELEKLDITVSFLYSELIRTGYSKYFLYRLVYGIFVSSLAPGAKFDEHYNNFKDRILLGNSNYDVIFRIDSSMKVHESISAIEKPGIKLSDTLDKMVTSKKSIEEMQSFSASSIHRKFIRIKVESKDYLSALKIARVILSENLDIINLGLSGESLLIHNRALIIDQRSPEKAQFQNNGNILDGKYRVEKDHYLGFMKKLPKILFSNKVQHETKEKIKSAIRYLRLGNESVEVEHKFINYWIGLEYLFSNYESQSTINRIKLHFINAHLLAYVKRNTNYFKSTIDQLSSEDIALIKSYTIDFKCMLDENFYTEISETFLNDNPLISYRAMRLKQWLFRIKDSPNATDYIRKHKEDLEVHFTRIYRLRNEIIHDAATNTNNEQIASNLRYYLTFILNEIINFLFENCEKDISLEDFFILNEIKLGNIELNGFQLDQLLDVNCTLDFIS